MSRLDDHVSAVQNKLAMNLFVYALAWCSAVFGGAMLLGILVDRIFLLHPPRPILWIYGGAAASVLAAMIYAIVKRPAAQLAAVAIDQKLGLQEKISTALLIRNEKDIFAKAAVLDAENTAAEVTVNLRQNFPMRFPKPAYATIVLALAAVLAYFLIDPMQLFGRQQKHEQEIAQQQKVESARSSIKEALATVEAMPKTQSNAEAIKLAKADLQAALNSPIKDPEAAKRTAVKALQDVNQALKDEIKNSAKYAEAQNEMRMLHNMQQPIEGQGPVADAQRSIVKADFTDAMNDLEKAVDNFDKMDKADQKKTAQQMQQLAQQLQQQAQNNPQQQQKMQQQMQQMGMNQQQAQQAQQLMQQAAQGNPQAQQQLQQMAQQAMQQMNNGQGPNAQQKQAMQQMMQQMQAQANAQQQAQQMGQAAQQMAQAMQQAAQQQGQQQQNGQQQNQQGQQMNQAMNQMQQQMQQMQAMAADAKQMAAAQQAAQAAQGQAQNAMNGNNAGGQGGQNGGQPGGQQANAGGQWGNGQQQQGGGGKGQGNGPAGQNNGGQASGDRTYKQQAPYTVKPEMSPSQDEEAGRILASTFIKDNHPLKNSSTATLKDVAEAADQEQTDEIDQDHVSRQAQSVVHGYFGSMSKDDNN